MSCEITRDSIKQGIITTVQDKLNNGQSIEQINNDFKEEIVKVQGFENSEKRVNFTQQKIKNELQNIISGKSAESKGDTLQTTQSFLRGNESSSSKSQGKDFSKEQEQKSLEKYIQDNNLWYTEEIKPENKIGEGAEQSVYRASDDTVIKLNDSIFYASWEDYLNNLLLHNYFFPDTKYELKGFKKEEDKLFAVVEQPFVQSDKVVKLDDVEDFLRTNGFIKPNPLKNDYKNEELGLILEDLHDENVLLKEGQLFFTDTVFYTTPDFYKSNYLIEPSESLIDKYWEVNKPQEDNKIEEESPISLNNEENKALSEVYNKYPVDQERTTEQAEESLNITDKINKENPLLHSTIISQGDKHFISVIPRSELGVETKRIVEGNTTSEEQGEKLMQKVLWKMKKVFPDTNYQFISQGEAANILQAHNMSQSQILTTNSFVDEETNTVYLISGRFTPEIVAEEFLHPFTRSLQNNNTELFDSLFDEAFDKYEDLSKTYYHYLKNWGEEAARNEVVTRALSYMVKDFEANKLDEKSKSLLEQFLDWIKSVFESFTSKKIPNFTSSTTLNDIAKIISDGEYKLDTIINGNSYNQSTFIDDTFDAINNIQKNSGIVKVSDEKGYVDKNNNVVTRITDIAKKVYKKIFNKTETEVKADEKAINEIKAEKGVQFHLDVPNMFKFFLDENGRKKYTTPEEKKAIDISSFEPNLKTTPKFREKYISMLYNYVSEKLDTYSEDARFMFETIVHNPETNVAGTVDFIAIDNDGVDILDWKTIYSLSPEGKIWPSKKKAFNVQLNEYYKAIKNATLLSKDKFKQIRVIPILPSLNDDNLIEGLSIGKGNVKETVDGNLLPLLATEDSAFTEPMRRFTEAFNEIIKQESIRKSQELGYETTDYTLQAELEEAITRLITQEDPNTLLAFIANVEKRIKKYLDDINTFIPSEKFTPEELEAHADSFNKAKLSLDALAHFEDFADEALKNSNQKDRIDDFIRSIQRAEKELGKARTALVNKGAESNGIMQINEPEERLGFLRYWTTFFTNARTKTVKLLNKLYTPLRSNIYFDMQEANNKNFALKTKLMEWGKKNNKNLKEVFDIFTGKDEQGNFNGKLQSKIKYLELNQAKEKAFKGAKKDVINKFLQTNYDLEGYKKEAKQFIEDQTVEINKTEYSADKDQNEKIRKNKIKALNKRFSPTRLFEMDENNFLLSKHLKEELWHTDFYKTITQSGNEALLDFYNYTQEIVKRINETGKTDKRVKATFLPQAHKGYIEGGFKNALKVFTQGLQINPEDYEYGSANPANNKKEDKMYIPFTQDLGVETKEGKLDYSLVSQDLLSNYLALEFNLVRIENVSAIEAFSNLLDDFEAVKQVIPLGRFGNILKKRREQKPLAVSEGIAGLNYKYYNKFKRYVVYGQRLQDFTDAAIKIPGTDVTVSGAKVINSMANLARSATFGINVTSPLRNLTMGRISTIVQGSKHFNGSSSYKSFVSFIQSFKFAPSDERHQKIAGALQYFLPYLNFKESHKVDKVSMNSAWQILTPENIMGLMDESSKFVQIPIFLALLENSTVRNGEIVNINELVEQQLKDKFKYNNLFDLSENSRKDVEAERKNLTKELSKDNLFNYMEISKEGEFSIKGVDRKSKSVFQLRELSQAYAKKATGEMSEDDINLMRTSFEARMVLMYRSWIPRTVQARFGKFSTNDQLGQEEGRIRSLVKTIYFNKEKSLGKKLKFITSGLFGFIDKENVIKTAKELYNKKVNSLLENNTISSSSEISQDEFIKMYLQNVKAAYNDIKTTIGLFLLVNSILLSGMGGGGDDEQKQLAHRLENELKQYYGEFSFYYDPTQALQIIKNPFPITSYATNLLNFSTNLVKETYNPDHATPAKFFFRAFPISKQLLSYMPLVDADMGKELGINLTSNSFAIR